MGEFLNGLSNKTWFVTIVSFLAANFATIVTMALVIIKNKIKAGNVSRVLSEHGITLNKELNDKLENIEKNLEEKTDKILESVYQKLKIDSEEKKAQVESNSLQIKDLIKATTEKITLSLDDGKEKEESKEE